MYPTDTYLLLQDTGGINMETADIHQLWIMEGSSAITIDPTTGLQGEPSAANLAAYSNLLECDWTGYGRKAVPGRDVRINTDTVPHQKEIVFDPIEYTGLVAGTDVVGIIWYVEGASDALRIPILVWEYEPTLVGGVAWVTSADGGALISSI